MTADSREASSNQGGSTDVELSPDGAGILPTAAAGRVGFARFLRYFLGLGALGFGGPGLSSGVNRASNRSWDVKPTARVWMNHHFGWDARAEFWLS